MVFKFRCTENGEREETRHQQTPDGKTIPVRRNLFRAGFYQEYDGPEEFIGFSHLDVHGTSPLPFKVGEVYEVEVSETPE